MNAIDNLDGDKIDGIIVDRASIAELLMACAQATGDSRFVEAAHYLIPIKPRRSEAIRRRDELIRELAKVAFAGMKPRPAAEAIAAGLKRYAGTGWLNERREAVERAKFMPSPRREFFLIMKTGAPLPAWRRVFDLLK